MLLWWILVLLLWVSVLRVLLVLLLLLVLRMLHLRIHVVDEHWPTRLTISTTRDRDRARISSNGAELAAVTVARGK